MSTKLARDEKRVLISKQLETKIGDGLPQSVLANAIIEPHHHGCNICSR